MSNLSAKNCSVFVDSVQQEIWDFDVPDQLKEKVLKLNALFSGRHIIWESFDLKTRSLSLVAAQYSLELDGASARTFFSLVNNVYMSSDGRFMVEIG